MPLLVLVLVAWAARDPEFCQYFIISFSESN